MKQQVINEERGGNPEGLIHGVSRLRIQNFRNIRQLDLQLSQGFNIVSGQNAQGKTNLLEALFLLSTARILRGNRDRDAITYGEQTARVTGMLSSSPTEIEVRLEEGLKKAAYVNGLRLPRASDLLGRLPCVSVSSEDMCLAKGEPADRRLFLDLELSQTYAQYLKHFAQYKRSLEHRNALLKRARESRVESAAFEPWEQNLSESGCEIRKMRNQYLLELLPHAEQVHEKLARKEVLDLRYVPKDPNEERDQFRICLEMSRNEDVQRGSTSVGPHRDDFYVEIQRQDARTFASQGQQRTAVISIKLATLLLAKQNRAAPLLLLDDMLSDLDQDRRSQLAEWTIENAGQAVLTCTEPEAAGKSLLNRSEIINMKNGSAQPTRGQSRS